MIGIQRVEPNPGSAVVIIDISSDVQLQEIGCSEEGREQAGTHISHEKGDDAEISGVLERIHIQSLWQGLLDDVRIKLPVQTDVVQVVVSWIERNHSRISGYAHKVVALLAPGTSRISAFLTSVNE